MAKMFNLKPQVLKTPEQAYSELLGSSGENQIVDINISLIDEIDNQPQKIHEEKISKIAESMRIVGQLDPCLVVPNPKKTGRYLLLAGRHRKRACLMNGLTTIKAVIKNEKDTDKQRLMLLATNNDRNTDYLPSELAFSYLEQSELLQKLGSKSTASTIASENNTNRKSVHKYIQLTHLITPLLNRVDSGAITVGAGYELSFLTMAQQNAVFNFLLNNSDCKISKTNARLIRDNPDNFKDIFRYSNPNFSESQTIENQPVKDERPHPKAEKKTKNTTDKPSNTKKKCPSEGHLNLQIPYEVLMTVAAILYKETYSIYQHIISEYATTSESVNFIKARYANNKHLEGTIYADDKSLKYIYYYDGEYKITFKNKLSVSINCDTKIKYTISYAEIDTAIRRFIRKFLTLEDIILMLKEAKK